MHFSGSPKCKKKYNEFEIEFLKEESKLRTKQKARQRYQANKAQIAAKYQQNKAQLSQKHKENREANLKKMSQYYEDKKNNILVKRANTT